MANARKYCKDAIMQGYLPIAPHIFYTQMLDDDIEAERAAGLALGMELLKTCDEIWIYGSVLGGMIAEVQMAEALGLTIKFMQRDGGLWEWPKA